MRQSQNLSSRPFGADDFGGGRQFPEESAQTSRLAGAPLNVALARSRVIHGQFWLMSRDVSAIFASSRSAASQVALVKPVHAAPHRRDDAFAEAPQTRGSSERRVRHLPRAGCGCNGRFDDTGVPECSTSFYLSTLRPFRDSLTHRRSSRDCPRYFEGGVSSVYLWDQDDGFAGVVLIKKGGLRGREGTATGSETSLSAVAKTPSARTPSGTPLNGKRSCRQLEKREGRLGLHPRV
ncbi:MAG: hypothetical protein BJ554DRAFT_5216 [Olpidium bornovanus]|uniref:F-actin-capping protein subunit beta n=1 Tax=Olpidium bornovanus TaxID=278681 RepID=A0A8H7ZIS4_9FUNG|nr:MAG: hypothetical protein BJ554DRAFT_5216 [Olpidium bornovanus]